MAYLRSGILKRFCWSDVTFRHRDGANFRQWTTPHQRIMWNTRCRPAATSNLRTNVHVSKQIAPERWSETSIPSTKNVGKVLTRIVEKFGRAYASVSLCTLHIQMVDRIDPKNERFVRLAEKRVNELLDRFRLVGNLADKRNYVYTDEQARLILKAIEDELRNLKAKFVASSSSKEKAFRLTDTNRKNERTD